MRPARAATSRVACEPMLIFSMSVSVDGFIADREGGFAWGPPSDELFRFHLARVSGLGGYLLGRRLYENMLAWETDPSLRESESGAAFADVWSALPKVVFSHTLDSVQGNARLAEAPVAEEIAAVLDATDKDVEIGGAGLAAAGDRARPRRRAAPVPPPGRRRWRHAAPATRHRRHRAGPDRDQDVRLARDLRALPALAGVAGPGASTGFLAGRDLDPADVVVVDDVEARVHRPVWACAGALTRCRSTVSGHHMAGPRCASTGWKRQNFGIVGSYETSYRGPARSGAREPDDALSESGRVRAQRPIDTWLRQSGATVSSAPLKSAAARS